MTDLHIDIRKAPPTIHELKQARRAAVSLRDHTEQWWEKVVYASPLFILLALWSMFVFEGDFRKADILAWGLVVFAVITNALITSCLSREKPARILDTRSITNTLAAVGIVSAVNVPAAWFLSAWAPSGEPVVHALLVWITILGWFIWHGLYSKLYIRRIAEAEAHLDDLDVITPDTHPEACISLERLAQTDKAVAAYLEAIGHQGRRPVVLEYKAILRWREQKLEDERQSRRREEALVACKRMGFWNEDNPRTATGLGD